MKWLLTLLLFTVNTLWASPNGSFGLSPTLRSGLVGHWTMNDAPGYSYAGPFDMVAWYKMDEGTPQYVGPYDSLAGWWKLDLDYGGPVNGTRDGLVAWYKMDEGTGTLTTADSSGNGNTGYLTNAPAWTNGVVKSGLKFNGVQSLASGTYISISNSPSLQQIQSNITISAWVNAKASVGVNGGLIVIKTVGSQTPPYEVFDLILDVGFKPIAIIGDGSTRNIFAPNVVLNSNTWYHCSFTYNGSQLIMYTNGITIGTTNFSTKIGTNQYPVTLGSCVYFADAFNQVFDGTLDDVRIYNRALSASEITAIYQAEAGTYAIDSSTNNNLTLINDGVYTNGVVRGGLAFNLSPNAAKASISAALDITNGSITLCAWCYPTNLQAYNRIVMKRNGDTTPISYSLGLRTGGKVGFEYSSTNGYNQYNSTPTVSANTFSHVAITYTWGNSASATTYINGVAVSGAYDVGNGTSTSSDASPTYPVTIGGESAPGQGFGGVLDDVRIYNRVLTTNEIANIYRAEVGNYTADSSGNGNTGYLTNAPAWTNGVVNSALKFDGSTTSIGTSLNVSNYSQLTYCAWVKYASLPSAYQFFVTTDGSFSGTGGFSLAVDNNNRTYVSCYNGFQSSLNPLTSNAWYFVCGSATNTKAGNLSLYINGVIDTNGSSALITSIGNCTSLNIGRRTSSGSSSYTTATIDDVRIYNRVLSASEIANIYNTEVGNYTTDSSGNGNTGYLTNSPAWTNGVVSSGLAFFGTNAITTSQNVNFTTNKMSFAAWLYITSTNGIVIAEQTTNYNSGNAFLIYSGGDLTNKIIIGDSFSGATTYNVKAATNNYVLNQWFHLAAVIDRSLGTNEISIYFNGISQPLQTVLGLNSSSSNLNFQSAKCYFASRAGNGLFWNGFMDDIRIYNRALSSDEILKLYNGGYGTSQ